MTKETLLKKTAMPEEAAREVLLRKERIKPYLPYCERLTEPNGYERAYEELCNLLPKDDNGFFMLSVMLEAALITYEKYRARGISDEVYFATMECFSRFVKEHKVSFGVYGFDRGFWTGRQLSLTLFRIGAFEYERTESADVALHIPSGAPLGELNESVCAAKQFFLEQGFPMERLVCTSWLLSPELGKLLSESSRIAAFQKGFRILNFNAEDEGYKVWLFQSGKLKDTELPENTSLQRAVKRHILSGGKIGSAFGEWIDGEKRK